MKQVIVPQSFLNQITKQLAEMKQTVAANEKANDLVSRKVACEILDIDSRTFTNKKIAPDSINDYGQKFYSRKKLLGI